MAERDQEARWTDPYDGQAGVNWEHEARNYRHQYEALKRREQSGNGVEATIGGQSFRAWGPNIIAILAVLGLLAANGLFLWRTSVEHSAIVESLDAVTYVLTLPQEERANLKVNKPKKLRGDW